jgi:uncharacterized protein
VPLAQELPDFRYVPRGVDASGRVTLNERRLEASFLVSADTLVEGWRPRSLAELRPEDLEPAFALGPAVLLLGTGVRHAFPAPAVLAAALTRGIGLEAMDNAAAARTFAVLAGEGRRVVAAFLVPPA